MRGTNMVNFENLAKIRDWLAANDVPFDMEYWRKKEGALVGTPFCGTHGCIIGWCPEIPGLEPIPEDWRRNGSFRWLAYASRITGIEQFSGLFDFLFAVRWAYTKYSSKEDAIARLDWVVREKILTMEAKEYRDVRRVMKHYVYGEGV